MFDIISLHEGSYGTIWGPCTGNGDINCSCPQCENANRVEESGLDWDEEYKKAMENNFKCTDRT